MSGARFVRLYPSDWRSGCIGMTLEQEGLYIRVCTYIYETGLRLSLDDSKAAKFLGLHTNAYTKVRRQLAALGKLTEHADGWTVARAERELAAATNQKGTVERQADQDTPGETRQDTLGDTPHNTPIDTPIVTNGVFSENDNEINEPLKSLKPVTSNQVKKEKSPLPPEGGSDDMPKHVRSVENWNTAFGETAEASSVRIVAGQLVLVNGTRTRWLAEFGDDAKALDLALIEIRGQVQPNSRSHSLEQQTERHLARIVRDKSEKDRRYREAVAQNVATKAAAKPSSDWSAQRIDRAKAFAEKLKAGVSS